MRLSPLSVGFLLSVCLGSACLSPPAARDSWKARVVCDLGIKMGGCAVGDLLPDLPGNEIAVTTGDGLVVVAWASGDGFKHEVVAGLAGEAIQCAIGELDPTSPGAELVTVGKHTGSEDEPGQGVVLLHRRRETGWESTELLRTNALMHAVAIGDADPLHSGNELVVGGFTNQAFVLRHVGDGRIEVEATVVTSGPVKGAAVGLRGAVLAQDDGRLVEIVRHSGGFEPRVLFEGIEALARVAATNDVVLFGGNDGRLRVWRKGAVETVLTTADRLRGAVLADLDVSRPGVEGATAGYDGFVRMVCGRDGTWVSSGGGSVLKSGFHCPTIGSDDGRLHHLAAGEVGQLGMCLVACGYSGRLLLFSR
ncbi:MAG TPA: hypothetical protein EYQ25_14225 [Planctomycetes bacterium]|nr:hypothetical protein [Planctomycetota bacterium]HIL38322.1 hypothetical protein [Planctomycetota bacterium]